MGGQDGYLEEIGYPVGHGDGSVAFPAKHPNAYALRVKGDSMRPRIKPGEFIVVEPDIKANNGDDVVVLLRDGRKMLKQLLYIREGDVSLASVNENHPRITLAETEIDAIHYVAAIVPSGAFYKPKT